MDRVRKILSNIGTALGGLSASHKLIIGLLVVVAALTLLAVVQFSGRRDMVPLLPGEPAAEQQRAADWVASRGVDHKIRADGVVLVPAEQQRPLFAQMAEAGQLPSDKSLLFGNLADKTSWTMTRDQQRQMSVFALQNELARWISQFEGVEKASVFIDVPEPMGLGTNFRKPTASVAVIMRAGRGLDQRLVDAIAHFVSGARSGLEAANVRVIDGAGGKQRTATSGDDLVSTTYLDYATRVENQMREKILGLVGHIPGAVVAVTAQVDVTKASIAVETFMRSGEGTVSLPKRSQADETTQNEASRGAEPGLRSNVTADVTRGGGSGATLTQTQSDEEFENRFGKRTEQILDPRGMPTALAATINIPRSYIVGILKAKAAAGADGAGGGGAGGQAPAAPTDQEIDDLFRSQRTEIETAVKPHLIAQGLKPGDPPIQGEVKVTLIPVDYAPPVSSSAAAGILSPGGLGGALLGGGGTLDTVILSTLAVVAVGMMLLLVRRAGKRSEMPTAEELVGKPMTLASGADLIGEADESDAPMAGIEVNDDEMKVSKMLDQVKDLVTQNPADAARLVNRWVTVQD